MSRGLGGSSFHRKGVVFLGVSNAGSILYYDEVAELVVEYFGETNPYIRSVETHVPKDQLPQWLKDYHWAVGLKYMSRV